MLPIGPLICFVFIVKLLYFLLRGNTVQLQYQTLYCCTRGVDFTGGLKIYLYVNSLLMHINLNNADLLTGTTPINQCTRLSAVCTSYRPRGYAVNVEPEPCYSGATQRSRWQRLQRGETLLVSQHRRRWTRTQSQRCICSPS